MINVAKCNHGPLISVPAWANFGACVAQAAAMCRDIGYDNLQSHFSASNFLRCQPDAAGMILTADFHNYLLHKEPLLQLVSSHTCLMCLGAGIMSHPLMCLMSLGGNCVLGTPLNPKCNGSHVDDPLCVPNFCF
jgi:hypothetical protein